MWLFRQLVLGPSTGYLIGGGVVIILCLLVCFLSEFRDVACGLKWIYGIIQACLVILNLLDILCMC